MKRYPTQSQTVATLASSMSGKFAMAANINGTTNLGVSDTLDK